MPKDTSVEWHELDQDIENLETCTEHKIIVKREAIPLVFVPGIMGSKLRITGTDGTQTGNNELPDLRWNPDSSYWMIKNYSGESGAHRRLMLVGPSGGRYNNALLEVHNSIPVGNGFQGVSANSYLNFLEFLQNESTWGPLQNIFDFPVYAVGYNWTDSSLNSGRMLANRIDEIIKEAKEKNGKCEKVILITHSMGGIVARSASELAGARDKIMGIIHGVQPATGAAAAYWRVKAGFEGMGPTSRVLGNSGPTVTPVLGNIPGGLELLPNMNYRTNNGRREWLTVRENNSETLALPINDPYEEIYRIKGTGSELDNPEQKYWGLIDPDLLDPALVPPAESSDPDDPDMLDASSQDTPWDNYLGILNKAETFHNQLDDKTHANTYTFHGTGHDTADRIEMISESFIFERDSYPKRGFRGRYTNAENDKLRAVLQDPSGTGDGTVPISSASSLDQQAQRPPAPLGTPGEHEPIYKSEAARDFTIRAIASLCSKHYEQITGKSINK